MPSPAWNSRRRWRASPAADEQHPARRPGQKSRGIPTFCPARRGWRPARSGSARCGRRGFQTTGCCPARSCGGTPRRSILAALLPDLGVAEIHRAVTGRQHGGGDDGVGGVLGQVAAVAHGDALGLQFFMADARRCTPVYSSSSWPSAAAPRCRKNTPPRRRRCPAPGRRAGSPSAAGRRCGVAPVHGPPHRVVGVVLVEQVVAAVIVAETVGVVHPAHQRRQVETGRACGGSWMLPGVQIRGRSAIWLDGAA